MLLYSILDTRGKHSNFLAMHSTQSTQGTFSSILKIMNEIKLVKVFLLGPNIAPLYLTYPELRKSYWSVGSSDMLST